MTTNAYTEAGRIAAKIRKSEQRRDRELTAVERRHQERCFAITEGASDDVIRILCAGEGKSVPVALASEAAETVEAPVEVTIEPPPLDMEPLPELSTIAPSLREPVPPLNAIVKERNR